MGCGGSKDKKRPEDQTHLEAKSQKDEKTATIQSTKDTSSSILPNKATAPTSEHDTEQKVQTKTANDAFQLTSTNPKENDSVKSMNGRNQRTKKPQTECAIKESEAYPTEPEKPAAAVPPMSPEALGLTVDKSDSVSDAILFGKPNSVARVSPSPVRERTPAGVSKKDEMETRQQSPPRAVRVTRNFTNLHQIDPNSYPNSRGMYNCSQYNCSHFNNSSQYNCSHFNNSSHPNNSSHSNVRYSPRRRLSSAKNSSKSATPLRRRSSTAATNPSKETTPSHQRVQPHSQTQTTPTKPQTRLPAPNKTNAARSPYAMYGHGTPCTPRGSSVSMHDTKPKQTEASPKPQQREASPKPQQREASPKPQQREASPKPQQTLMQEVLGLVNGQVMEQKGDIPKWHVARAPPADSMGWAILRQVRFVLQMRNVVAI